MKKRIRIPIGIILRYIFMIAFCKRYEDTHRKWKQVMCDIWIGDSMRGLVVAENKDMIYIKGQFQCLMYCLDNPRVEYTEEEIKEMNITHKYEERYDGDDVKFKSECYRIWNNEDKMEAIINWYGWEHEE